LNANKDYGLHLKIYNNVKLHYWTYSSNLIISQSLSSKHVFLSLCFSIRTTEKAYHPPLSSFSVPVFSVFTYSPILTNMHATNPKLLHKEMYKFFPDKEREAVLLA
jgi:hypothetical protein